MSRRHPFLSLMALLVAIAACGGDDHAGGATTLRGALRLPPAAQCSGCSVAQRPIQLLALNRDAAPTPLVTSTTDAQGRYLFADADAALGGRRNVIVVASVSQAAGLGGVEDLSRGDNAKDFDVKTQVACQASVYLTAGTASAGDPGCVVRSVCAGEENCLATSDPSRLDDAVIERLERAAKFVEGQVALENDVPRAACAVIDCTLGGLADATSECVRSSF